jgi:hypothetical protein
MLSSGGSPSVFFVADLISLALLDRNTGPIGGGTRRPGPASLMLQTGLLAARAAAGREK